jgi:3',5'-cyclic AMP phosphodiesterase CpdA
MQNMTTILSRRRWPLALFSCLGLLILACRAAASAVVHDWTLLPDYRLPGDAAHDPGPRVPLPFGESAAPRALPPPLLYRDQMPTHRWAPESTFTFKPPFTVELWTVDHSHYDTGVGLFVRKAGGEPLWWLAYHANGVEAGLRSATGEVVKLGRQTPWRSAFAQYWRHIVLAVDQDQRARLWLNGELVGASDPLRTDLEGPFTWEISAYTEPDPAMRIENLLHRCIIHAAALDTPAVQASFATLAAAVEDGILFPGLFHFTAGPALTYAATDMIMLSFETDRPTTARIAWGESLALDRSLDLPDARRIHQATLTGLRPGHLYYYKVLAADADGDMIDSGVATFKPAAPAGRPVTFAAIGDTEARPHINDIIARELWSHRPDFVLHLGDLTDGGSARRKSQWTHEYFLAMNQLQNRIPVFAAPGNGEGNELHWFSQYFPHPLDQGNRPGFYHFRYGDVDFFMLDSNFRAEEFAPGGRQYAWLEDQLAQATAPWKVVGFHHPAYSGGQSGTWQGRPSNFGDPQVRQLVPLFDRWQVDLVLAAHIHHYERSHPLRQGVIDPAGTVYVVTGGAGGNLQDFGPVRAPFAAHMYRGYHYLLVTADAARIELRMYGSDGSLRDALTLTKPGAPQP